MQKTVKEESEVECIAIKNRWSGDMIFQSTKTTWKEAVEEAVEKLAYNEAVGTIREYIRETGTKPLEFDDIKSWHNN